MSKREINLMSDTMQALVQMGANIRKARLRRNLYVATFSVLELDKDIRSSALDEEGKKQFWERNLYPRERESKKR